MGRKKLFGLAVGIGTALAVVPFWLPAGPSGDLDAAGFLESGRFGVAAGVIFLGGLLTSLTPCVYPLIPITVGVFGARQAKSRGHAVVLTSAYVVGMGVVFSALGVLAALSGKAFGSSLGNPWVVAGLAVFLLILASSMFGAFELALPAAWATKLNAVGGSGLLGAGLMGSVSGFIAAPCTGPVLTGVLAFVARSQSPALGALLLFIYALGVGVPFFLIGAFTVRLPKGGAWMEGVKSIFGIALVALAFSLLRDPFPPLREALNSVARELGQMPGVIAAGVLTCLGVGVGAIHRSFKQGRSEFGLKAAGVLLVVFAVLLRSAASDAPVVGRAWGGGAANATARHEGLQWNLMFPASGSMFDSLAPFERALSQAKAEGKPVMIDFFAEWCSACKELDREVYVAPEVIEESARFVTIKVDGTNEDELVEQLYRRFDVQGLPTVAFLDSRGEILKEPRVTGFLPPEKFLAVQRRVR